MQRYKLRYLPLFYQDADEIISYITSTLENPKAARNLIDEIEKAILERSENAEAFTKYNSSKERKYPYYRIRVKNFLVFYVVIQEGNETMEVRRLLYNRRDIQSII